MQKERGNLSSELTKKMETLSHFNTRHVNKRANQVKNKNINLIKENEKTMQLEKVKVLNEQLAKKLDKALAEGVKYIKMHILKENSWGF